MMAFNSKPCRNGCGTDIHFDAAIKSPSGKAIPLEDDGQYHQCPNAPKYSGQGPKAIAVQSNPIRTMIDHENDRDQRIKEAQEQRKLEVDAQIVAMQNLTAEIQGLRRGISELVDTFSRAGSEARR